MKDNSQSFIRTNHRIRVPQVRLIGSDGVQIGVMATQEALRLAQDQGLDLVEINPKSAPPVCKIIDFGKWKYEEKKKLAEARKNQKTSELKEITLRPKTEENDLNHKLASAKTFLEEGNNVKLTVRFRGREVTHPQYGEERLRWLIERLKEVSSGQTSITMEGKTMSVTVNAK